MIQNLMNLYIFFDVSAHQKWLGAAILGFAFVISPLYNFSVYQIQGILVGLFLCFCYIMSINDYFDVEIDKIKERYTGKKRIVHQVITKRTALALTGLGLIGSLVSAWFVSVSFFLVVSFMSFLGTIYSVPPLRLKMKYPYSTLLLFIGDFLPFLAGVATVTLINWRSLLVSSSFSLLALSHRFEHEINYYDVDYLTGKKTVAVVNGVETVLKLRKICLLVGAMEFLFFLFYGWFSFTFVFLFVLYLFLCVTNSIWMSYLPKSTMMITHPVLMVSSFILFLIFFMLYGKFF